MLPVKKPGPNKVSFERGKLGELIFSHITTAQIKAECVEALPGYPRNGCAITLSKVLQYCGVDCPDLAWAEDLARFLLQPKRGRKTNAPVFGDIFVCKDLNANGAADHLGVYLGFAGGDGMFLALDNRVIGGLEPGFTTAVYGKAIPAYLRNTSSGRFTPVDYYISLL